MGESRATVPEPVSRPAMNRTVLRLFFLVPLALVGACADVPPDGLEVGISRVLAEIRSATLDDLAYHVTLRVPADRTEAVEGEIEVSFVWDDPQHREVVLDFRDPGSRVRSIEGDGGAIGWRVEHDHIVLDPDDLRAGEANRVRIAFVAGDEALNRHDDYLYTLFVPDRAHFSIPVFDQPDLKAEVTWTLTVPEGWVAVANGPEVSAPSIPAELRGAGVAESGDASAGEVEERVYTFAPTRPIPPYLMAFAAGRFTVEAGEREGREYRIFHRETDDAKVARNRGPILDLVATSMAWMEEYTAIPHPFAKYDLVLLPSFQYGGMEHPGAVFYRAESLLLDEAATRDAQLARASLIAHETAHMWFGNLVTMRWFDDVWTKEVFANFLAARMVAPSFPDVDHDLRFLLAHHPAAYGVDRTAGTHPIRQPLDNLRDAGTLYGPIIYQKAPIVMRQLELRVGERLLRSGLRQYLGDHAFGNASWPELIRILDERTPDDLEAWSRAWVDEPGRPRVAITLAESEAGGLHPVITQSDPAGKGRLWPQQLLLVEVRGLRGRIAASIDLKEERQQFPLWAAGSRPRWILPNGRGVEYGLFVLDTPALVHLVEDVTEIPQPLLRGAAWLVIEDAFLEGRLSPGVVLGRTLDALAVEDDELLLGHLIDVTTTLFWSFLSPAEREEWAERVEATFEDGLARAESVPLRAAWYQGWRRIALTEAGIERLHGVWSGDEPIPGLPLSEADRTALAVELAVRGHPDSEAILDAQRERISNPDRQARFDFLRPALAADEGVREEFFTSLARVERRANEEWVLAGLRALNHPLRQDHARRFLRPGLDLLTEIQATGDIFFPGRWVEALLGGHQTPEAEAIVAAFLAERPGPAPRLREKVLQSHDRLARAAAIVFE